MKYIAEKFNFTKQSISEMKANSKKFYVQMKRRRSVRYFDRTSIDINIIKNAILSAATAPSGANLQPWHFVIIKNNKLKKVIRKAAEKEEKKFYKYRAPEEWLKALKPLGTDTNKKFLEDAPFLIAVFEKKHSLEKKKKIKNYYVKESVGIATGFLISCLHLSGLCMLTHTPSPMNFLNKILKRPPNEKAFILLVVGYPISNCNIPKFAKQRKPFKQIASIF